MQCPGQNGVKGGRERGVVSPNRTQASVNVAAIAGLSENTVRTYVRRLYSKLGVNNRADLVRKLMSPEPTSSTPSTPLGPMPDSSLAEGDDTLKRTKYLWLFSEENLPEKHAERFARLKRMHLKTGRARCPQHHQDCGPP